jgi:hypothetical protein
VLRQKGYSERLHKRKKSGNPAAAGYFTSRSRQPANSGSKYASFSSSPMGKRRARLRSCCRSYCKPPPCSCFLHGPRHRSWTFPSPPYRILLSILLFMKTRFSSSCTHSFPVLYPLHDCTTECRHKRNARGNVTKLFNINQKKTTCQGKLRDRASSRNPATKIERRSGSTSCTNEAVLARFYETGNPFFG